MDNASSEKPTRQTTKDKKYDSVVYLCGLSARLKDGFLELSRLAKLSHDMTSYDRLNIIISTC